MKFFLICSLLLLFVTGCTKYKATLKLNTFLQTYSVDINDYKVICFVPAEGCASCIYPSVDYSKKAGKDFLLVLTSCFQKSINILVEAKKIDRSCIVSDSKNLASINHLVQITSPCFYFLKNGHIIKIVDLDLTYDKTNVYKEIDQYLSR